MGNYNYRRVTKNCLVCGTTFACEPRNRFCSKKCAASWRTKNCPKWLEGVRAANKIQGASKSKMMIVALKKKWKKDAEFRNRMITMRRQQLKARKKNFEYLSRDGRIFVFRSKLELGYGEWLDRQNLTWAYERDTFLLSDGTRYTPDFWVQEWETYVEISGGFGSHEKAIQAAQEGRAVVLVEQDEVLEKIGSLV